jgi:glutamine synthetase
MKYTKEEVKQYVIDADVKFIRMAFCDVFGKQKNVSIMPEELDRAFDYGIAIDASAIDGFGGSIHSDLLLHPDSSTLSVLPWRPDHGKVIRMYCTVTYPDGHPFEADTRSLLIDTVEKAKKEGLSFYFGSEMEFYLFNKDESGNPTKIPYDNASYMDIAPEDKGENVRREICLTLEQMGIRPESSHHEEGPGQNEIDFRYSDAIKAADDAITFRAVVNTIAARNGLHADFSPKPLENEAGNSMHINVSVRHDNGKDLLPQMIAGIIKHIKEMTVFLNPSAGSYERFGSFKAPKYISWSPENRSQLIRIPAAEGEFRRIELRSPDTLCNPYIAFSLIINACINGIKDNLAAPDPVNLNLYKLSDDDKKKYESLPDNLVEAKMIAKDSGFIKDVLSKEIIESYIS